MKNPLMYAFAFAALTGSVGFADEVVMGQYGAPARPIEKKTSTVYVPTQFFQHGNEVICYGYRPVSAVGHSKGPASTWESTATTASITADSNVSGKVVNGWRRVVSNTTAASTRTVARAKGEVGVPDLPPIAEFVPEKNHGQAQVSEPKARSGRLNTVETLEDRIDQNPDNVSARYTRGSLYQSRQDYMRAIEDYSHVIQIDPSNANAYYKRGLCYTAIGRPALAQDDFRQANRISPENRPWVQQSGGWMRQSGF